MDYRRPKKILIVSMQDAVLKFHFEREAYFTLMSIQTHMTIKIRNFEECFIHIMNLYPNLSSFKKYV